MPLTAPNEGLCDMLDYVLSAYIEGVLDWQLMLWTNDDLVIDQDTVYDDLVEAQFYFYTRWTLARDGWTDAVIEDDAAVSTWGTEPLVWTPNGTGSAVYGYAIVTQDVQPVIRVIEAFESPIEVEPESPISVLPQVTMTTYVFCDDERRRSVRRRKQPRRRR